MLTSLYALFIIVFAVVVELSQKFTPDEWFSETVSLAAVNITLTLRKTFNRVLTK